jgi:hypothetical protein
MLAAPVAAGVRDGRLVAMPQLGHFGPLEDPVAAADSIRSAPGFA